MQKKSEIDQLAARYLDLWERQLAALSSDADFEAHLQRWLAQSPLRPKTTGEADDG